jgi:hypothetical protein
MAGLPMTLSDSAVPIEERYFEDYVPGAVSNMARSGSMRPKSSICPVLRPQDMHVDPGQRHGAVLAVDRQRWHTAAMMMRLLADNFLPKAASLASPGIDELRWLHPVRPGDVLRIRVAVLEATRSRSKPDRGMVRTLVEVLNQRGEIVMSLKPMNIIGCRGPA